MIIDSIGNYKRYVSCHEEFEKAFHFIENGGLSELADGRVDIDGDRIYALVQSYLTKPEEECKWEAHREYIDIQFMAEGRETIGWARVDHLEPEQEYSAEKDIVFFRDISESSKMCLEEGTFMIFFPEDAHKPCCRCGMPAAVKKVVIKIKADMPEKRQKNTTES